MKKLLLALLLTSPAWANQSLQLNSAATGALTIPAVAPFNTSAETSLPLTFETRLSAWATPSGNMTIWEVNGISMQIWTTGEICARNDDDNLSIASSIACGVATGHPDVTVRIVRDTAAHTFGLRIFDTSTGAFISGKCGYIGLSTSYTDCPVTAEVNHNLSGSNSMFTYNSGSGAATTAVSMAWFKIRSSLPADLNAMPGEFTPANIADFKFENNLTNAGTGGYAVTITYPTPTYVASAPYPPVCSAGTQQAVRAGGSLTLNGSNSYSQIDAAPPAFAWQLVSGPSKPLWSSHTTQSPTLTGIVFGDYKFQLTVTDSLGESTSCTQDHGVVATDANGVVVSDNPFLGFLVQPILMHHASTDPWGGWDDDRTDLTAAQFYSQQGTTFAPVWRNASAGTISITNSYAYPTEGINITGVGTSFKADFCGGGTSWDNDHDIVIWYPNPFQAGTTSYRHLSPTGGCADDTHMTIGGTTPFWYTGSLSNTNYSKMSQSQLGVWINGSNNANYYDNVMGYYSKWLETGLDIWHTAAQTLADKWWESPLVINGTACWDGGHSGLGFENGWCSDPRRDAIWGMMLRATEVPEMWPGIYLWVDARVNNEIGGRGYTSHIYDTREEGVKMGYACTAAAFMHILGLDPTRQAAYIDFCMKMATIKFAPGQADAMGAMRGYQYGVSSNNGNFAYVNVTNGSTTVTNDAGGDFKCGSAPIVTGEGDGATRFWAYYPNTADGQFSGGDPVSYAIDACSQNTLTLHVPYAGTTGTIGGGNAKGAVLSAIPGTFSQPYMQGYLAGQLELAVRAMTIFGGYDTEIAAVKTEIAALNTFNLTYGYRPATAGMFYLRGGLTSDGTVGGANGAGACEPDPETANNNGGVCTQGGISESRFLISEMIRGFASQCLSGSCGSTFKNTVDALFGGMWGGYGVGPSADSNTANNFSQFYPSGLNKAKDFGFCCGVGGHGQWKAARVGVAAANVKTYRIPFRLANFANAAKVRVTLTNPSGVSTATVCTTSPCAVTPDARQGAKSLYKLEYLTSGDAVISASDTIPLNVQP